MEGWTLTNGDNTSHRSQAGLIFLEEKDYAKGAYL